MQGGEWGPNFRGSTYYERANTTRILVLFVSNYSNKETNQTLAAGRVFERRTRVFHPRLRLRQELEERESLSLLMHARVSQHQQLRQEERRHRHLVTARGAAVVTGGARRWLCEVQKSRRASRRWP